jgi:universal stress protein A
MAHLKRILVPTDFSRTSDLALQYAFDLATSLHTSIHLVHVIETPRYAASPDGYFVGLADLQVQLTREAEQRLSEVQLQFGRGEVTATTQVAIGIPAECVVELARDRGSDLIVMGTHGRSGVAHFLMGSVAERVVRSAPCPVLTVRDTPRVADLLAADDDRGLARATS